MRNVVRFVKHLRKLGIDANCDMFESVENQSDRGFYFFSKLYESEYVFVVCSSKFYEHTNSKSDDGEADGDDN